MSLERRDGDLFATTAELVVIPVNTVGVMGAGLAQAARQRWPECEDPYRWWCKGDGRRGGDLAFWADGPGPVLAFLATKEDWRAPSRLGWVDRGLRALRDQTAAGSRIATAHLGAGLGGLAPFDVEQLMVTLFAKDTRTLELWTRAPPAAG